ncbi:MAG: hypothetical protein KDA44_18435 [Planctomycetales bacterium]|nr:hypothetical protein [Planctomycetales bacterium]
MTRSRRAFVAAFALLSFAATFCWAGAADAATRSKPKYRLAYKFRMGEVLRYRVEQATSVRTTIDSKTQEAETLSESTKAWKVTDVLPNGEMEFVHLVEAVRMTNHSPGVASHTYDSEKDPTPPPGFEQVAGAVNTPISVIRISPTGKIVHREEKHPQPPVTDDMPITLELPAEPVAVGGRWSRTYDVMAERKGGAKIKVRTRRTCKLRSVTDGVATIEVEYHILTPVDPFVRSQLVERLTSGKVLFDIETGRIVEQDHRVDSRVLGFAGQTSVMRFASRFEERLVETAGAVTAASHTTKK